MLLNGITIREKVAESHCCKVKLNLAEMKLIVGESDGELPIMLSGFRICLPSVHRDVFRVQYIFQGQRWF